MSISPLNYACTRLARRPHSVSEIKALLTKAGYDSLQIQLTIEKLLSSNYLNDKDLAQKMLDYFTRIKPCGPFLLEQKMFYKGLPADIIHDTMLAYDDEKEIAIIESITNKIQTKGKKNIPFMVRQLQRKGFSLRNIRKIINNENQENDCV